jgi:hypothetical protein
MKPVGKNHTGSIIGFHPDEISSIHGSLGPQMVTASTAHFGGTWIAASFNYSNLALTPVPLSVYLDQPSCYDSFCSTIYTNYEPVLSVPQQVLSLDPAWKNCDVFWGGVYDPPKALQPTNELAGPTTPGGYASTTTAASPSSTPPSPTISATALAETTSAATSPGGHGGTQSSSTEPVPPAYSSTAATTISPTDPESTGGSVPGVDPTTPPNDDDSSTIAASDPTKSSDGSDPAFNAGTTATSTFSPSNALEALTQSVQPPSSDPADPTDPVDSSAVNPVSGITTPSAPATVVFTQSDGQRQTAVQSSGNLIIGATTTIPAGSTASINGIGVVSVATSAVVVSQGEEVTTFSYLPATDVQTTAPAQTVVTAGGQTYTVISALDASAVEVEASGTTVSVLPNSAASIDNQAISFASDGNVVIGSQTVQMSEAMASTAQEAIFTLSSTTLTALLQQSAAAVVVDSSTLTIGGPDVTIQGAIVSAADTGIIVVDGVSTRTVTFERVSTVTEVEAVLTAGSTTLTAYQMAGSAQAVVVEGTAESGGITLSVGGSDFIVDGHTITLASDGLEQDGTVVSWETTTVVTGAERASTQSASEPARVTPGSDPTASSIQSSPSGLASSGGERYRISSFVGIVGVLSLLYELLVE